LLFIALFSFSFAFTSLNYYVNTYDEVYSWKLSPQIIEKPDFVVYNLYLTSQQWLTKNEVNHPIWTHWLQVCIPNELLPNSDMAFLYINGGSNANFESPPSEIDLIISRFAVSSGTIGASLNQIPNQPIYFAGDPDRGRSEDAMIAYTWSHWVNNTFEYDWLARMPMTKASMRAMDALQEFVQTLPEVPNVNRFGVAGGSKRGWTTWMVGAMQDPRVVAIIPIVAPIANLVPQINEMWQSYGNWSFALKDYVEMDLIGWLNLPRFEQLLDIIDPLSYPEAMAAVPKYVVAALGDEFFMPDAAQYYWPQLKGSKYLYLVPNAEHSLAGHINDVLGSAEQFYLAAYYNQTALLPEYTWQISADGTTVSLSTSQTNYIVGAKAYYSYNNTERDWRLITCTTGLNCVNLAVFGNQDLQPISPGYYEYTIPLPAQGLYSAFMIEIQYDFGFTSMGSGRLPLKITSDLSIVPRGVYPYPPCPQDVCKCGYECANNYYGGD